MPSCPGIEGCLSLSILTSLTLPLAALTAFSSTGVSCLQGPHHPAQKSTSTGWRLDSSITSLTKVWVVVSFTASLTAAVSLLNMVIAFRPSSKPRSCRIKWCRRGCLQSGILSSVARARQLYDPRRVAGRVEELEEVERCNRGGHGIAERVSVERAMPHQIGIEDDAHAAIPIVHGGEGRHRAGLDPQCRPHELGRAEGEAAAGANAPMQRFELDCGIFERGEEDERPFLVLEEEILGMSPGDAPAQRPGLLDGEQGSVRDRPVRNAEAIEKGEEIVGRGGHGGNRIQIIELGRLSISAAWRRVTPTTMAV